MGTRCSGSSPSRLSAHMTERDGLIQLVPAVAHGEVRIGRASALAPAERARLVRQAKLLAWAGNAWHLVEFAIAVGAGIAAGSIALVGFGADSLIEALAGFIIIWRFAARRTHSETAERRAQQLIAASYLVLAAYIVIASARSLIGDHHPDASWNGLGLAAFTAPTPAAGAPRRKAPGRPTARHT